MSTREKGDIGSAAQYIIALNEGSAVSLSAISDRRLMCASTLSRVVSRTGTFVINHKCQMAGYHEVDRLEVQHTFALKDRRQRLYHRVEWTGLELGSSYIPVRGFNNDVKDV